MYNTLIMQPEYKVKTGVFEGPMELLLSLIEKEKLAISEISLSKVTDDFILYLKELGSLPIGYTANFIITAAMLVLIKSRSLLPNLFLTDEEEGDITDLQKRLELYRFFRSAGEKIRQIFAANILFKRQYGNIIPVFVPDKSINLNYIEKSLTSVLANAPKKETLQGATVEKVITLEEMMDNLSARIQESLKISFNQFANHNGSFKKEEKVYVIVSFLALLELVKQGIIAVHQKSKFEDIDIEKLAVNNL